MLGWFHCSLIQHDSKQRIFQSHAFIYIFIIMLGKHQGNLRINKTIQTHNYVKKSHSMRQYYNKQIDTIRKRADSIIGPLKPLVITIDRKIKPRSFSYADQRMISIDEQRLFYKGKSAKKRVDQKFFRMLIERLQRQEKHKLKQKQQSIEKFSNQKNYKTIYQEYMASKKRKQDESSSDSQSNKSGDLDKEMTNKVENLFKKCRTSYLKSKKPYQQKFKNSKLEASYEFIACRIKDPVQKKPSKQMRQIFTKKFGDFALPHSEYLKLQERENRKKIEEEKKQKSVKKISRQKTEGKRVSGEKTEQNKKRKHRKLSLKTVHYGA